MKSGQYEHPTHCISAERFEILHIFYHSPNLVYHAVIFGPQTDVIVNTIAENMNLKQGAVSTAILQAAGHSLQSAVLSEAPSASLQYGDIVVTDGFNLKCQKVFHAVCPGWDNEGGQAEEVRR